MSNQGRLLLETNRFRVEEVSVQDGSAAITKPIVRHPGAVAIIPVLADDRICLIRNQRAAVRKTLVEIPAGTREATETPAETAHRELIEETGYEAAELSLVREFFMSPGILDERMYLFVARDLHYVGAAREPGEQIENLIVPISRALEMVDSGQIEDAKTLVGLLHFARSQAGT